MDAEDLVDEIEMVVQDGINISQVRQILLSSLRFSIPEELSKILKQLSSLVDKLEKACLNFSHPETGDSRPNTCLVDESSIISRGSEKEQIIQMVLSDQAEGGRNISVIPIVGMGGVGKTALAQIVFQDPNVGEKFDYKAWISLSSTDNVEHVTGTIFNELFDPRCSFQPSLNEMHVQLQNRLRNKKFLIILDNVWEDIFTYWDQLVLPLQGAAQGSKILITTRSANVTYIANKVPSYNLNILSDDDCWNIIKQTAVVGDDSHQYEIIGLKLAKMCKGLPLAAKVMGVVLRSKNGKKKWGALLECELWESLEFRKLLFPTIQLSYNHLSSYLRRCFAYCSIFPQNNEFEIDEMVQLWAAEGFIQAQGRQEIEEVGSDYVDLLCSRSLFQDLDQDKRTYKMHELVHDLARMVANNVSLSMTDNMSTSSPLPQHARYSSLLCKDITPSTLEFFHSYEKLQTFLLLSENAFLLKHIPSEFFKKLRRLRVLKLSRSLISDLPDSFENLIHLRYLNLSFTLIKSLPKSIEDIHGLETVKLKNCVFLLKLPDNLSNLIKLRHLEFAGCDLIICIPPDVGKLTNLETLSTFIVGKGNGKKIGELKNLRLLRGSICIKNLENVVNSEEAEAAMLHEKEGIEKLELEWNAQGSETVHQEVLSSLKPHAGLKELQVVGYCGLVFPSWISDSSFSKLESICLKKNQKCTLLPSLGVLPTLKYLLIESMDNIDYLLCTPGTFPSLEQLEFVDMLNLKYWSGIGESDMPHLKTLSFFLPSSGQVAFSASSQLTRSVANI